MSAYIRVAVGTTIFLGTNLLTFLGTKKHIEDKYEQDEEKLERKRRKGLFVSKEDFIRLEDKINSFDPNHTKKMLQEMQDKNEQRMKTLEDSLAKQISILQNLNKEKRKQKNE